MYSYQECICAACDHRFMQQMGARGFQPSVIVLKDKDGNDCYEEKCPKCGEILIVTKGKLETIIRSECDMNEFEVTGIRGI